MSSCSLGNLAVWLWLHGVDKIRKFDSVLYEEDRDVVSHQVWNVSGLKCLTFGNVMSQTGPAGLLAEV
jgi:hypothetical protein